LLLATQPPWKTEKQTNLLWRGLGVFGSGICFGLSLQIKFYTLLILPACIFHLFLGWQLQDWRLQDWKKRIAKRSPWAVLWLTACALIFVAVGLSTNSFGVTQLLNSHFNEVSQAALQREPSWLILLMFLVQDLDYSLLAGLGVWILLKHKPHWPSLPLVWLITVLIGLAHYKPLWYHYYPLISVPLVWLATYGLTQSFSFFRQTQWYRKIRLDWRQLSLKGFAAGFAIFAIALLPIKSIVIGVENHLFVQDSKHQSVIIQKVQSFQAQTNWLFTDLPITSFYTHLKVPPELAVFSTKRIESGNLSNAVLLKILQTYQPEQVLLGRYPKIQAALQPYLDAHYVQQYKQAQIWLYVLKSLVNTRSPSVAPVSALSPPAI
jgi:hypothetical protein